MTGNYWDLANKPQTKIKLKILNDYLSAWAKIFAKQEYCEELYYVDCFAGRGKYNNEQQKDAINGSPLIALDIARNISVNYHKKITCFFVEKDPITFKDLQRFVAPFETYTKAFLEKGDVNLKIDDILAQIPSKRWCPIFFFIDPGGIDIKKESIEKMLDRPNIKEFLITYIQKGVERCLGLGSKANKLPVDIRTRAITNLRRVEDFFGTSWKGLTKNERDNLKKYLNTFVEYNERVLEKDKLAFKGIDILYNQGRNKYYLIFISRNKNALSIIDDIYRKTKVDGTLFVSLPTIEKKKIYRFDID